MRCGTVQEVKHTITARDGVVLCGQVIQTHQVEQRDAFDRTFSEIAIRCAVGVAVVEDVQHKVLRTNLVGPDVVDVLHHQVPNGHLCVHRSAFQQLSHQHLGCVDALVGEFTDLIDLV